MPTTDETAPTKDGPCRLPKTETQLAQGDEHSPSTEVPLNTNDLSTTNEIVWAHIGLCRLLLKTETQLVQGDYYLDKITFLRNTLTVTHFGREFDKEQERWHIFGDHFALANRLCYMLVDHGDEKTTKKDIHLVQYKLTREGNVSVSKSFSHDIEMDMVLTVACGPVYKYRSHHQSRYCASWLNVRLIQ